MNGLRSLGTKHCHYGSDLARECAATPGQTALDFLAQLIAKFLCLLIIDSTPGQLSYHDAPCAHDSLVLELGLVLATTCCSSERCRSLLKPIRDRNRTCFLDDLEQSGDMHGPLNMILRGSHAACMPERPLYTEAPAVASRVAMPLSVLLYLHLVHEQSSCCTCYLGWAPRSNHARL